MKLIVGNWKMYPRKLGDAKAIVGKLKFPAKKLPRTKVVVCPPTLYILPLVALLGRSPILLGAQNTFTVDEGAYTGETSPAALVSSGATHAIVGHSERRALGEDDAVVAQKAIAAVRSGLTVVLCVGEAVRDPGGAYFTEVGRELRASLSGFPKNMTKRLVVAYEPIWAIGSSALRAATPEDFREMSIFIKRNLVDRFGKSAGFSVPILYGGSVDEKNAGGVLKEGGADGLLVGRASLDPERFSEIVRVAVNTR